MSYEAVIGLEVHAQLRTATKIFCRCRNRYGAEPNTLICPVCLGYPGTLPVLNREAVDLAIRAALALGAEVRRRSVFARKNYFYPDLPKGYQITQYDQPLAVGGRLPLVRHPGAVRIRRLHLEEDAGKLLHEAPGGGPLPDASLVDFNRCGVPLVEIVTEPDLRCPAEAQDCLRSLRQLLLYTGTSDGNLEEGSLRCDANVSVRPAGATYLGTSTEVKNLNSVRFLARALEYEIERQTACLSAGAEVVRETRTFDPTTGTTRPLRSKEEEQDYRYFPEPDLPPLVLAPERIRRIGDALPELPWALRSRLRADYGLGDEDARILSGTPDLAAYFETAVAAHPRNPPSDPPSSHPSQPQAIANWVRTEIRHKLRERQETLATAVAPPRLARLVALVDDGQLSHGAAKKVLAAMWDEDDEPDRIARRLGLVRVGDPDRIAAWVGRVVAENPDQAAEYRAGKEQLMGFFIGQVMRLSQGRADPRTVRRLLSEALRTEAVEG